ARRHAVDRDVVRAKLHGEAARVLVNGGLGDRVDGPILAAARAGDRTNGDDPATLASHQLPRHFTAAQDAREQVSVQHSPDVRERDADTVIGTGPAATTDAWGASADVAAGVGYP